MKFNQIFFCIVAPLFFSGFIFAPNSCSVGIVQSQRSFGSQVDVNIPISASNKKFMDSGSSFGVYEKSLTDVGLDEMLAETRRVENERLEDLRNHFKKYSSCGGLVSPEITKLQHELRMMRRERHKIGTVQIYRQCRGLSRCFKLSDHQIRLFNKQQVAYNHAKFLQLTLSTIPREDEDFKPLRSELESQIAQYNKVSVDAGRDFLKMRRTGSGQQR